MKRTPLIHRLLRATVIGVIVAVTAVSCGKAPQLNKAFASSAITLATSTGLRLAVKDTEKREVIKNYIYVGTKALRSITGTPNAEDLTKQINSFIPENIKHDYPEILAFVIPLVVTNYASAYEQSGPDAKKLYQALSDIATAIEAGVASA